MFERNKDLSQVFDEVWKANHNDDIKNKREKDKAFIDKMFDVKNNDLTKERPMGNMQRDFNTLNHNINGLNELNRKSRINDLKGKL